MVNSRKLKARMVEQNITQSELAKAMSLSQATVNQKINNTRAMTIDEAFFIQNYLSISKDEFKLYFFDNKVAKCNKTNESA